MRILIPALALVFLPGCTAPPAEPHAEPPAEQRRVLQPGDEAPPFELNGSDGRTYRLADYRGKQVVVLAWFARAFSDG